MKYSPRYRAFPSTRQRGRLQWATDIVRQTYNHALHRFNRIDESEGTLKQRVQTIRDELPDLKEWWTDLTDIYSTVLQKTVERIEQNVRGLAELRKNGYKVGSLNWKSPTDFRSITYRQRGFELDTKSGPDTRATLTLKKVKGVALEIPIRWHRDLPDDATIKEVTVKEEPTGKWFVSFCIETETPEKPDVEEIDPSECVGIDLGITSFTFDSNGLSVGRLGLSEDRARLERAERALLRKEHGSSNWEDARVNRAEIHKEMSDKKSDFKHKLAHFYTTVYSAVFLEDLNVKGMLEGPDNARNKAEVGWRDFIEVVKYHGRKNGCHVETVAPENTTIDCASCGTEVPKSLWVREHSCPTCGFETDRDWNAALNVLARGLKQLGVVHSEETPVETGAAMSTNGDTESVRVDASAVVESGSPCLKERTANAVSE